VDGQQHAPAALSPGKTRYSLYRRLGGPQGRSGRVRKVALPPGKTRYPLYRRLGGSQGRSGRVRKISPPPIFDPRTVQPVASRYTDRANRPKHFIILLYFSTGGHEERFWTPWMRNTKVIWALRSAVMWRYVTGNWSPTFGTTELSRNVGHRLSSDVTQRPIETKTSITSLRNRKNSHETEMSVLFLFQSLECLSRIH
jgi:hypothetical protein